MGAYVDFETGKNEKVQVRIATSFISIEQARKNLEIELKGKNFNALVQSSRNEWQKNLSRIKVNGITEDQKTIFYTAMFHTMQWVDIDGDGKPELITGKRYRAHDTDPGVHDAAGLYYYKWNGESFTKQIISYGPLGEGKGTGLYFAVADLRGTGRKDIVVAGKDGLYVFYNDGAAAAPNKGK